MNRPVNERQLEVLQWIADGCPERSWRDESHKHSARALQSRGLAQVSRIDGRWAAAITESGRHFLEHGTYPAGPPETSTSPQERLPRRRASESRASRVGHDQPLGPPAPNAAQWLYLRLMRPGGRLEIADHELGQQARDLVNSHLAPQGKVLRTRRRGWHHQLLYFTDDPEVVVPVRAVPVPMRLTKPHPVAARYRDDRDHHEVSKAHLSRALRVVHALATTFDELGLHMTLETRRTPDGQFHVRSGAWGVSIRLSEKSAPGGAPLPHYFARQGKTLPAWQARRQKQFISTGKLTIQVGGAYAMRGGRQLRFSDTRTHQLEDVLPGVVREVEMGFLERRQETDEAEREAREQQVRWERVLTDAEIRATEAHRAHVLAERASSWREWQNQSEYLDHLEHRLAELSGDQRAAVTAWIQWSRRYLAQTDPMRHSHEMPPSPAPTREFLAPHIRDWAGPLLGFTV